MSFRRKVRFFFQRLTRGWDDSELWSLNYTIAKFTLPRLQRFKNYHMSYPNNDDDYKSSEDWQKILDKMIYGLQACIHIWYAEEKIVVDDVVYEKYEDIEWDWFRVSEGLELFGKYFRDLWD